MKKLIISILIITVNAIIILGNDNETESQISLSLTQAQEYAIEHNISMQSARIDAAIAEKRISETRAIGLPQINASAGYQYYFEIPISLVPAEFFGGIPGEFAQIQFGTEQNLSANLSVNQLIFDGSYFVGLRAAKIYREIAQKNIARSELDVKTSIAQTYYLALITSENLRIIQNNLENMQKIAIETVKLFEAGFTDKINKEQLELTISRLNNAVSNFERQQIITLNLLKFQLGMDMSANIILTDNLNGLVQNLNPDLMKLKNFNPKNHIEYKIVQSWEEMQEMNLQREKTTYYPSLSGNYIYQESAMRNEFSFLDSDESWFPTSFFGINLNIPIFSSGMRSSKVQQAKLELDKARLTTLQTEQVLELQLKEALAGYNSALEKYQNDKSSMHLAERIFDRTNIMHKEGLASSLELTQANDQLLETQSSYLRSVFELLNARNELDKALGIF